MYMEVGLWGARFKESQPWGGGVSLQRSEIPSSLPSPGLILLLGTVKALGPHQAHQQPPAI